jgi:hypothetical protein
MKTNIFKYLKFLSITAFSSAVMFTAAFGACATTVNVGGNGMTQVGSLTGVTTTVTDDSSAVNVGTLGKATRQEVRFLAVPFASTTKWKTDYSPDKSLSASDSTLIDIHTSLCSDLDAKQFSLGKTNTLLSAEWAPLTIERAMSLYNFITIPPLSELNIDPANNLISPSAVNYNLTKPLFNPGKSGAFALAAEVSTHNYQQYRKDRGRYKLPQDNDDSDPVSLGNIGGAYPSDNRTVAKIWGNDWFPLCYTKTITNSSGDTLVNNGDFESDVPLYWYPTLQ